MRQHASVLSPRQSQVDGDDSVLCGVELQEIRMEHTMQAAISCLAVVRMNKVAEA